MTRFVKWSIVPAVLLAAMFFGSAGTAKAGGWGLSYNYAPGYHHHHAYRGLPSYQFNYFRAAPVHRGHYGNFGYGRSGFGYGRSGYGGFGGYGGYGGNPYCW